MTDAGIDVPVDFDTDVLVVGTGPTGATTALGAGHLRRPRARRQPVQLDGQHPPRAHHQPARRRGSSRPRRRGRGQREYATPWERMGDTLFTTSLAGAGDRPAAHLGHRRRARRRLPAGQPLRAARHPPALDGADPAQERRRTRRGLLVQHRVPAPRAGRHRRHRHAARPADRTRVRRSGRATSSAPTAPAPRSWTTPACQLEGQLARAATAYVLFRADLTRYVAHRPSILYWIVTSDAGFGEIGMGLLRAIRPWNHGSPAGASTWPTASPTSRRTTVKAKIRILVGDPDLEHRDQHHVRLARQPGLRHHLLQGTRLLRRRRRAPPSAVQRPGLQHLHAGRLQPRLEARLRRQGPRRRDRCSTPTPWSAPRSAQQIVARANQSRLDYAPLNACFAHHRSRDPVAAGLEKLARPQPRGRRRSAKPCTQH